MSQERWKVLDGKVMSSTELHLSNEMICNIMEEKSAKGTWDKLEKLYIEADQPRKERKRVEALKSTMVTQGNFG
ncbi:hypothetical protein LWI28_018711 [Acer negundo]|uniref:Uncharacterized protein n=1 Tax=Acer negundo TaxID=4023 RepID=A0AAD5NY93_ACENE|nr:hypothetical protein LWI28_018711 [Acer negundo]